MLLQTQEHAHNNRGMPMITNKRNGNGGVCCYWGLFMLSCVLVCAPLSTFGGRHGSVANDEGSPNLHKRVRLTLSNSAVKSVPGAVQSAPAAVQSSPLRSTSTVQSLLAAMTLRATSAVQPLLAAVLPPSCSTSTVQPLPTGGDGKGSKGREVVETLLPHRFLSPFVMEWLYSRGIYVHQILETFQKEGLELTDSSVIPVVNGMLNRTSRMSFVQSYSDGSNIARVSYGRRSETIVYNDDWHYIYTT
eukprot:Lankesteria_metandrocarpae@DN2196_c0_g1_i1.p1